MSEVATSLECYTLEEILELNDLTPEDALLFLVENDFVTLPETKAIEFDD